MVSALFGNLKAQLQRRPGDLPKPGLYHYSRQSKGERIRIHLRVDADPSGHETHGILLVNANRVLHLNPTATLLAFLILERVAEPGIIRVLTKKYNVSTTRASGDYAQFVEKLEQIIRPDGACPICDLDIEVTAPFSARPSSPYRMDLALTYRCNDDCAHCYNARPRDYPELKTGQWIQILDLLWKIGIAHVVFTGGEPTLRSDLPELIAHAEENGQITGLNTNARRLSDSKFVHQLVDAGLDHVQITLESHDAAIHDHMVRAKGAWKQTVAGLQNALDTPLYVMTNTTLLRDNSPHLGETLDFLASLGVPTVGLNALIYSGRGVSVGTGLREAELPPLLEVARQRTESYGQRLIWYTPTQYCNFDPMQLELGVKGCTAALYNMCVEPDGGVIPCQSYYHPLGNLLKDPWNSIWNHDLSVSLRERRYIPSKCEDCALLSECGGGCPLVLETQAKG
ncbi:MAG TPA: radical SAM protein [Anaerolineales bacterium]|nr:radical SAM protein [Anaerolineales bacterium]